MELREAIEMAFDEWEQNYRNQIEENIFTEPVLIQYLNEKQENEMKDDDNIISNAVAKARKERVEARAAGEADFWHGIIVDANWGDGEGFWLDAQYDRDGKTYKYAFIVSDGRWFVTNQNISGGMSDDDVIDKVATIGLKAHEYSWGMLVRGSTE